MKRFTRLIMLALLAVLLVVALGACTDDGESTGAKSETENSASENTAENSASEGLKPGDAGFQEFPIGDEMEAEGMSIAGVYFQAVEMEPVEKAGPGPEADIHIEADIKALKNNKAGFAFGEFVPYLQVRYEVEKVDTGDEQTGSLMPMNASDGPHYGRNITMDGAGQYKVTFTIESPEKMDYLLHVDSETGVPGRFWKKPIEVSWDFNYIPIKK